MPRELVLSMMLENEVGYGFTHRIDGVIQVLVYDLDNGEEVLLLFDEVLWGLLWWGVLLFVQQDVVWEAQNFVQDVSVLL